MVAQNRKKLLIHLLLVEHEAGFASAAGVDIGVIEEDLDAAGFDIELAPDGGAAHALEGDVIAVKEFKAFVAGPFGRDGGDDGGEEDEKESEIEDGRSAGAGGL